MCVYICVKYVKYINIACITYLYINRFYKNPIYCFFFLIFFFKTGFLFVPGFPGIPSVDKTGLELTEILFPLPAECWD